MFRQIYKFLASLQFAIVLLTVIIIASIFGTIYETSFNADVAQKWIYNAPWFNAWMTALCVNLFCVAAIRYPWKRHQTGFVITHAGIITLLIGAMIDRMWGIEGFMHLHTTKEGSNVMELHTQELSVKIGGAAASTFFKINTLTKSRPLNSPDPKATVEIVDVQPVQNAEIAAPAEAHDPEAVAGLNFTLQGANMGRNDLSIFLGERKTLGPRAQVFFVRGAPKTSAQADKGTAELALNFQGKGFRYLVKSGESKTEELDGFPEWKIEIKGYFPNFIMDEKNEPHTRDENPQRPCVVFDLVGPAVAGIELKESDPHGGPTPKQKPNEILPRREKFYVYSGDEQVMTKLLHGEPTGAQARVSVRKSGSGSVISGANGLAFYLGEDGKLRYFLKARDRNAPEGEERSIETTGDVEVEKPIPVGWGAPGTECIVHDFIENAEHKLVFLPHPEMKKDEEGANQGVEVAVTIGGATKKIWIGQTEVDKPFPQVLDFNGTKINFGFCNQTTTIPFAVGLKKFSAPTDEGSNEFAAFESILGFKPMDCSVTLKKDFFVCKSPADATPLPVSQNYNDPIHYSRDGRVVLVGEWQGAYKREVNRYNYDTYMNRISDFKLPTQTIAIKNDAIESVIFKTPETTAQISMNRPTTFPVSWYGPWLGTCYKFSQASHHILPNDPEHSDPNYSGVQVLRDPGWLLKWVGCIMINFGIFTMFYLRPYFNRPKVAPKPNLLWIRKRRRRTNSAARSIPPASAQ